MAINPNKIQVYLKEDIKKALHDYRISKGIENDSQAVNHVLGLFFQLQEDIKDDYVLLSDYRETTKRLENQLDLLSYKYYELLRLLKEIQSSKTTNVISETTVSNETTNVILETTSNPETINDYPETTSSKTTDDYSKTTKEDKTTDDYSKTTKEDKTTKPPIEKIEKVEQVTSELTGELTGELTSNSPLEDRINRWETTTYGFKPCFLLNKKQIVKYYISTGMTEEEAELKYQKIADSKNAGRRKEI